MINFQEIGKNIRHIRESEKGIKQEELAHKTGFKQTKISRIEKGVTDVTVSDLLTICEALEVGIERILSVEYEIVPKDSPEYDLINNYRKGSDRDKKMARLALDMREYAKNINVDEDLTIIQDIWKALPVKFQKMLVTRLGELFEQAQKEKVVNLQQSLDEKERAVS